MKELVGTIVSSLFAKLSAAVLGHPSLFDAPIGHGRAADQWDEALLASMSGEIAARFLDFWGPRWR